ncbi:(ribosomal protein S5)-alanine N-acetyltransferase [uncultured Gammaproteobacteria bacterium]
MFRLLSCGNKGPTPLRLEDERVMIRPPNQDDWRGWGGLRAASREFLRPWEPAWPEDALTRDVFERRVRFQHREWQEGRSFSFLTFDRRSNALVGGLHLGNIRRGAQLAASLGYWIGQPYARCGYMTAAARLAIGFAFSTLGLHRVEASCLPDNLASRALLEKLGFVQEGLARRNLLINGDWRDHLLFAVLAEEWQVLGSGSNELGSTSVHPDGPP